MKKITILTLHLGYGGLENCVSSLSNILCNDYEINIVSTYKLYDEPPFKFDKRVKIEYLIDDNTALRVDLYKQLFYKLKFIKLFKTLYNDYLKKLKILSLFKDTFKSMKLLIDKKNLMIKYIKNCDSDIIISTRDIHNKWLGEYGNKKSLKIGWEHNHHHNDQKYISKIIESVKNLDYFVLVSKSLTDFYKEKLKGYNCECIYIPNGLDDIPEEESKLDQKNIISVGRLAKEKGYEDLIDIFALVHQKYPDWYLNIVGDGALYDSINKKIKDNKLDKYIKLHGFQKKDYINKLFKKSSIYVMTSLTESFGLALLEAMSYGIPCLAFDSAEGALEIIDDGINGYLISNRDKKEMVDKIIELIDSVDLRRKIGKNAVKKSLQFNQQETKKKWISILK